MAGDILETAASEFVTIVVGQVTCVQIALYFRVMRGHPLPKYHLGPRPHRRDNQGFSGAKARPELTPFINRDFSKPNMKLGQVKFEDEFSVRRGDCNTPYRNVTILGSKTVPIVRFQPNLGLE